MYSLQTVKLLKFIFNTGSKLKCFPFVMVKNKGIPKLQLLEDRNAFIIWRISTISYAVIQLTTLSLGMWYDLSIKVPTEDRAQFFMLVPFLVSGIAFPFLMLCGYKKCVALFNSFGVFGAKLRKFHKISGNYKDGIEIIFLLFIVNIAGLTLMIPPVAYLWLVNSVHMWELIKTDYIVLDIAISIFTAVIELADNGFIFFFSGPTFCYVAMTRRSLRLMKYNANESNCSSSRKKVLNVYRAHQIFFNMINEIYRKPVLFGTSLGGLLLITTSYLLIGFHQKLSIIHICLISTILFTGIIGTFVGTNIAGDIKQISPNIYGSYLRNDLNMGKYYRKQFKACKPIYVELGNIAKMDKFTFFLFLYEIVVVSVINLLIISK